MVDSSLSKVGESAMAAQMTPDGLIPAVFYRGFCLRSRPLLPAAEGKPLP